MLPAVFHLVVPAAAAVLLMMFALWLIHVRTGNASVVDPGWAFGLPIAAVTYAVLGTGYIWRRWLLAGMVIVWGVRLGTYLLLRIIGKPEEGRYQELRRQWKEHITLKFLVFFEFQALLDLFLSLPVLLAAFKRDPANQGRVCAAGLWRYSRHPNYFFEWLIWVAWALFALASPYGWLAILCPLLMFYFLFRVTGIPATEAQALRSKGEAYRRYQETTSAFVPWFKKPAEATGV